MGTTTNQIERHIEHKREDLGSNLQELENKVKSVADWRQQFAKNPMLMVGAAFGGGVMLATMMGGRKRYRYSPALIDSPGAPKSSRSSSSPEAAQALEAWNNIKGALIGVAATRFKDFVGEIVPGFHEEIKKTETRRVPGSETSDWRDRRAEVS